MLKRFNKKGFTLVELMVVIAILGILVTLGVLQYKDMVEETKIVVDLQNAQMLIRAARYQHVVTGEALLEGADDYHAKNLGANYTLSSYSNSDFLDELDYFDEAMMPQTGSNRYGFWLRYNGVTDCYYVRWGGSTEFQGVYGAVEGSSKLWHTTSSSSPLRPLE